MHVLSVECDRYLAGALRNQSESFLEIAQTLRKKK